MIRRGAAIVLVALLCSTLLADDQKAAEELLAKQKEQVRQKTEAAKKAHADNADMLVLPGLVADRKAQTVTIQAVTHTLAANDPVEFQLISEASEHDYEALATSFAKPDDIRKALKFIGMVPGLPADGSKLRLWPKGEHCTVRYHLPLNGKTEIFSPETMVIDQRTKQAPPAQTYIFIDAPEGLSGPGAIVSAYNEPTSVLDTPNQRSKDEIYSNHEAGQMVAGLGSMLFEVVISPEYTDGRKRVRDVAMEIAPGVPPLSTGAPNLSYRLKDADGSDLTESHTLTGAMEKMGEIRKAGQDVFLSVLIDDTLPAKDAAEAHVLLAELAGRDTLRLEPPQGRNLFYKAYQPNPEWRAREERVSQPLELTLSTKDGKIAGTLAQIKQKWTRGVQKPETSIKEVALDGSAALKKMAAEMDVGMPVLLIFVPESMKMGDVFEFIDDVREKFPILYVYTGKPT